LVLILVLGGELFTGNTMYFLVGFLQGNITLKAWIWGWIIPFIGNYIGVLGITLSIDFFAYLTDIFVAEPAHTNIMLKP